MVLTIWSILAFIRDHKMLPCTLYESAFKFVYSNVGKLLSWCYLLFFEIDIIHNYNEPYKPIIDPLNINH